MAGSPVAYYAILFTVGATLGSFIQLVAVRLPALLIDPESPTLIRPGSRCMHCLKPLGFIHNIPIISYLVLQGRCGYCSSRISVRYPVVELIAAATAVVLGGIYELGWNMALTMIFLYSLLTLSLIDIDHQHLPDVIVLPLLWLGLIVNVFGIITELRYAVFGAVAGYMFLWITYQVHRGMTGRQGMGYGDFKLFAAIGAWLGVQELPLVLAMACGFALMYSAYLTLYRGQDRGAALAFGPWLALAGAITIIYRGTT